MDEKLTNSENPIDIELQKNKIRKEILDKFKTYQSTLSYMLLDVPIAVLGLPRKMESALVSHGCLRVCDMINMNFTEIEGLNDLAARDLAARFDQFLAMLQ